MVDIISKQDGPRREDVAAKRLIQQNRPTIERLANQLAGGNYAARLQPPKPPQPDGFILHDMARGRVAEADHQAYVRISLNGRVVLVDGDSNKQLHHLGEVRDTAAGQLFVLATAKNNFFSPLDDELARDLADLDHRPLDADYLEDDLAAAITERLGLN